MHYEKENERKNERKKKRIGKFIGQKAKYKRAVVTLQSGSSIDLFSEN